MYVEDGAVAEQTSPAYNFNGENYTKLHLLTGASMGKDVIIPSDCLSDEVPENPSSYSPPPTNPKSYFPDSQTTEEAAQPIPQPVPQTFPTPNMPKPIAGGFGGLPAQNLRPPGGNGGGVP